MIEGEIQQQRSGQSQETQEHATQDRERPGSEVSKIREAQVDKKGNKQQYLVLLHKKDAGTQKSQQEISVF